MKVHIYPDFGGQDEGGGVRRVVEAQRQHLPSCGVELVDDPAAADLIACHIMAPETLLRDYPDKPLVAHSHGLYWGEYTWPKWALRANVGCLELIRAADAITAPSEWVAQAIRRNTYRDVVVIGHGVNLSEWPARKSHDGFVLWNKTRVDPVCDPEPVLKLASLAPDVQFVSTFGDERPNLRVTGPLLYEEGRSLVQRAAVYLATPRETFGIGAIEAMAAGAPVLGWRWAGQAEIVEHMVTGYLAAPNNYEDLERGLRIILDPANYAAMSRAARERVRKSYQWKDVVKRYVSLYEETLERFRAKRPTVSVVTTAYALDRFLPDALNSVKAQTLTDWECVVVDDASPDACGEIAESFAREDPRFRVIHNARNMHQAASLNIGIRASRGKYVLCLDADNMLPPNTLALLSEALDRDRTLHIAYGNVEFLELDGERWHSGWPTAFNPEWQVKRRRPDGGPANLIPSSAMYRRSMFDALGGYRERMRNCEDPDFWTRATSYGFRARMVTEADCLIYRNRPDSLSRTEEYVDWTKWYPWAVYSAPLPAGYAGESQPVASYEPVVVSVIIPAGPGHERLVVDAIDSVDAQTFRLWECIVVNDTGSALPWVPSWVRVLDTGGVTGVAHARNLGISASKGRLFVPLDADDTLEPTALSRMFDVWEAFGGYVYSDWYEKWDKELKVWHTVDYDPDVLRRSALHTVTAMYPKAAWEEVGGFDETIPGWEDYDFMIRLASHCICGTRIPEPLFTYRKTTGTRSNENYARKDENREAILTRWGDTFKEGIMAGCGSCRGGGGSVPASNGGEEGVRMATATLPGSSDGYALVEYVGLREGTVWYRAPSGQRYSFGGSESARQRLVLKEDVEYFTGMSDFVVRNPEGALTGA